ncbi:MAG: glycosyltransferase family 39 protein [Nitrospira sp.]|nr:glycosyltransferase family 39 protein [Nitrospira sp.]
MNSYFNIMGKQANQNRIENRDWYLLTGLILLGIATRCFMWYWIDASFLGDMIHYVDVAKDIGEGYILKAIRVETPPLYPLLIQAFYLFIHDYDISARLVNVVFGALLVYPVFGMAYWIYGRRTAILAGCLSVFAWELINYSLIGYAESVYLFFITMAFYKVVKAIRLKSNREMFFAGLCFGLTFLTKSQAEVFFALTLFWVLVVLIIEKKKIIDRGIFGVLLFIIGYGIMVAPYHYLQTPKEPVNVLDTKSNVGTKSFVKSAFSTYLNFNLMYEKDYMNAYVLHRDQNGYYYVGGGEPEKGIKASSVLSKYLSALGDRLLIGVPQVVNHLFPLALLFSIIGLFKRDWNMSLEGYLMAIIIGNIMAASLYFWNARYLDTLMPVVLIIGANGIIQSGSLLGALTSKIVSLSEGSFFSKGGKGWTILITCGTLMVSLVLLLQQKPDYSYNARIKHQKEVAENLKLTFGNNFNMMSWGIGRTAIPYYMGIRLSQVRTIPIASMDMVIGYAKQEGVKILAFDTEEIVAKGAGRYPGIVELLSNKGNWPGLQLIMVSPRYQPAVSSYKAWYPDSGWVNSSSSGNHSILVFKVI